MEHESWPDIDWDLTIETSRYKNADCPQRKQRAVTVRVARLRPEKCRDALTFSLAFLFYFKCLFIYLLIINKMAENAGYGLRSRRNLIKQIEDPQETPRELWFGSVP